MPRERRRSVRCSSTSRCSTIASGSIRRWAICLRFSTKKVDNFPWLAPTECGEGQRAAEVGFVFSESPGSRSWVRFFREPWGPVGFVFPGGWRPVGFVFPRDGRVVELGSSFPRDGDPSPATGLSTGWVRFFRTRSEGRSRVGTKPSRSAAEPRSSGRASAPVRRRLATITTWVPQRLVRVGSEGRAEEVLDGVAFGDQLLGRGVDPLAGVVVDRQARDDRPGLAVLGPERERVDQAGGDAVTAVGDDAGAEPVALGGGGDGGFDAV